MLRLSTVAPSDRNRHSFVPASRAVCQADAAFATEGLGDADMERLIHLGKLAAGLLDAPPAAMGHAERAGAYRKRFAEVGLMRSDRRVDHEALCAAFNDRWGGLTELIPGFALSGDAECTFLARMVRTPRGAAHPLQHLMLTAVLDGLRAVEPDRPFGKGPWPCRNPVADHFGRKAIVDVAVRRDRDIVYGDFACSCGYIYTRSKALNGTAGEPKFRRFGPLFAPALRQAVDRGDSLRSTARALGLGPKTLMREAAMASVDVPWMLKASGAIPTPSRPQPIMTAGGRRTCRRAPARRNWFEIDTRLARSARQTAAAVVAERPPVRVTFAEVERRFSKRNWVIKRMAKLPQTVDTQGLGGTYRCLAAASARLACCRSTSRRGPASL